MSDKNVSTVDRPLHVFSVDLVGQRSRIQIDGIELKGVRDIKVSQSLEHLPVITIELLAHQIAGIKE